MWQRRSCRDFLKAGARRQAGSAVPVPAGIKLVRIDPKSGMRAGPGRGGILEAFKPGTAPPDNDSVIGVADADGRMPQEAYPQGYQQGYQPDGGNIMRPGTGGLY